MRQQNCNIYEGRNPQISGGRTHAFELLAKVHDSRIALDPKQFDPTPCDDDRRECPHGVARRERVDDRNSLEAGFE
jgi:hypothetical protein